MTRVRPGETLLQARKRLEGTVQTGRLPAQPAPRPAHGADRGLELDLLTMAEGAKVARFDGTAPKTATVSFRRWLRREAVPVVRRGRKLLIERCVLVAALRNGGIHDD